MKRLILLFAVILGGCTTVRHNGTDTFVKEVDYPEINQEITVYVGDHMVQKGTIVEESVLVVHKHIDGAFYDIPVKSYTQIGYDNNQDFFMADGVIKGALSDPVQALSLKKENTKELCVITVFGGSSCYEGEFEKRTRLSERGNSFQQTLIYSGRVGDKINIGYREFSNNTARPAFNNDVEYDLSTSPIIGYKGAVIEVINADNSSITYKLIRNFP